MTAHPLKGWYRRGDKHPPHFDAGEIAQFVTFRLGDSLPQEKLREWKEALQRRQIAEIDYHRRIEACLDAGYGHCWLRDPRVAELVQNALLHFDSERYELHGWVVMPNHVHGLITPREFVSLPAILHSWKSFTSKEANRLLKLRGSFWQEDYFDRYIRSEEHFNRVLFYIAENPVRAGLCRDARDWLWSHVRRSSLES
jgi:putative DNA methylase